MRRNSCCRRSFLAASALIFRIRALSHRSQKSMQRYLENFFREEWNKEFGSDYAIYEYIRENKGIEDFLLDEEAVS